MRRRITKALLAAAAAGATITSLSFAAAGPAGAAQTTDVLTTNNSGWAAGNVTFPALTKTSSTWRFRYASATTMVPDHALAQVSDNATTENFAVSLANLKATAQAALYWSAADTAWEVRFGLYFINGAAASITDCTVGGTAHQWTAGSLARLDVYYDQATGTLTFTAYDGAASICSHTQAAWTADSLGGGSFSQAYAGSVFTTTVTGATASDPYTAAAAFVRPTAPAADFRLYAVTGVHFTSYNGTKGTVIGPWDYQQTLYGSSTSNIFVSSPVLWNGGMNFGVWTRA